MTAPCRIALLGAGIYFKETLMKFLTDGGFDVELPDVSSAGLKNVSVFNDYDLLIIDSELAGGIEEDFFNLLLSARGFLLVENADSRIDVVAKSGCHISREMSPEDIISRVNNVIFKNRDIRKSPRISVNLDVEYEFEGKYFRSRIQHLSLNGAFITTLNPQPKNAILRIGFQLSEPRCIIKATGRVLYSIGYNLERGIISHPVSNEKKIIAIPGMGVFFEEINASDKELIKEYIERNTD